jgi:hypothetical protein
MGSLRIGAELTPQMRIQVFIVCRCFDRGGNMPDGWVACGSLVGSNANSADALVKRGFFTERLRGGGGLRPTLKGLGAYKELRENHEWLPKWYHEFGGLSDEELRELDP